MPNRMLRKVFLVFLVLQIVDAWNVALSPTEERLKNRRAGENFIVSCKVKEYDGPASDVAISWIRDGQKIPVLGTSMVIDRPYASQLLINRPKQSDNGKYVCKAEVAGEVQETSAEISFVEPPKFVNPKNEQNPVEGEKAEIVCQVVGTEDMEVYWQFNSQNIDETSQRGYQFSEDMQTLTIPNYTSRVDDGIYSCNAAQYSSFETLNINVTGFIRPQITIFEGPSENRGLEGQTIELKCGATAKPKPSYTWYFDDNETPLSRSDKYNVQDGLLIIDGLNDEDAGSYKCIANNSVGSDTKIFSLSVFLKPKVEIDNEYVKKEGENVQLICNYHGEGQVNAKFVYGSQEFAIKEDPQPEIEEETTVGITDDESTSTSEEATEETDSITEATTSENSENTEHPEEDSESTTIEATEEPHSEENEEENNESKKWKRFADDVNSKRIQVRSEDSKLILEIQQLSLEDAGQYQCQVSNEAGTTIKTSQVNIIHPPTLRHYTGPQIRSFDGNTVSLYCDVSSVPAPKWKWLKDGEEVEANGASILIDIQHTSTKLTLSHNDGDDNYGRYVCKADNGVGILEKQIEVVHVVRPPTPTGMDCKKFIYPNYGRCSFPPELYADKNSRPQKLEFLIAKMEDMESNFNWQDALPLTVDFDNDTVISDLVANTPYIVKARAVNEAGHSEYTEETSLETTDPWAPQAPKTVRMECSQNCVISWLKPNDHGSEIQKYRIAIQELSLKDEAQTEEASTEEETTNSAETGEDEIAVGEAAETTENPIKELEDSSEILPTESTENNGDENDDDTEVPIEAEKVPIGAELIIEVDAELNEIQLTHIKPHSYYRVSVAAINAVGQGEALQIEHRTDETPYNYDDGSVSPFVIAGLILTVFVFFIIDLILFIYKRRGVAHCIINCCSRSESSARDVEAGKTPESSRLLDSNATSWMEPKCTTV